MFELFLFTTDAALARASVAAGVTGIVIDWETIGKEARQAGADAETNRDTLEDLQRVREATDGRVLCRINSFGPHTEREVELAIGAGADDLLLPMVRSVDEVADVLDLVQGRSGLGVLVETVDALGISAELGRLPLSRVFVGLHDLRIERQTASIFTALADGTVDGIRGDFPMPFGFGGLTVPEGGDPVPCRLLLSELARLRCGWTFLRRSYRRDTAGRDPAVEVPRIQAAVKAAWCRAPSQVERERGELLSAIRGLESGSEAGVGG